MKLPFRLACVSLLTASSIQAQEVSGWNLHGQATTVTQAHGGFNSPYQGPNSLRSDSENATSFTTTLMLGWRPFQDTECYFDVEGAAGKGVSSVLGMAGAPNGETYRVGNPNFRAAVARAFVRQTWNFGGEHQKVEDDAHQLAGTRDTRRLVVHVGKLSVMDVFDNNAYAHDPRSQFLNWTLMGHGAWDYPADTRGYAWGAAAELYLDAWAIRCGRFTEPLEANQMAMDHDLSRSHGDVIEIEHDHQLGDRAGAIRLMAYRNTARMGDYRESLTQDAPPDITTTREYGREKHGWGLNAEQSLTSDLGGFLRWSWSDGHTESWAFTEVDRSLSGGLTLKGGTWNRPQDRLGIAYVQNELSPDHRDYLSKGGMGFLLGDGRLTYAYERIFEAYYALAIGKYFTASLDVERCANPAYNSDRGPVSLFALRCHAQF